MTNKNIMSKAINNYKRLSKRLAQLQQNKKDLSKEIKRITDKMKREMSVIDRVQTKASKSQNRRLENTFKNNSTYKEIKSVLSVPKIPKFTPIKIKFGSFEITANNEEELNRIKEMKTNYIKESEEVVGGVIKSNNAFINGTIKDIWTKLRKSKSQSEWDLEEYHPELVDDYYEFSGLSSQAIMQNEVIPQFKYLLEKNRATKTEIVRAWNATNLVARIGRYRIEYKDLK